MQLIEKALGFLRPSVQEAGGGLTPEAEETRRLVDLYRSAIDANDIVACEQLKAQYPGYTQMFTQVRESAVAEELNKDFMFKPEDTVSIERKLERLAEALDAPKGTLRFAVESVSHYPRITDPKYMYLLTLNSGVKVEDGRLHIIRVPEFEREGFQQRHLAVLDIVKLGENNRHLENAILSIGSAPHSHFIERVTVNPRPEHAQASVYTMDQNGGKWSIHLTGIRTGSPLT